MEDIEKTLNSALSSDDEYVDAHIEMGWFHLVMLDDAAAAKTCFEHALVLLAKLNAEVVRGLLACDEELTPDLAPEAARIEYQDALVRADKQPQGNRRGENRER